MPHLVVLALSDSFAACWPALAAECGLELELVDSVSGLAERIESGGSVAGGGEESRLPSVGRALAPRRIEIAAVGADVSHRLATNVMRAGASECFALVEEHGLLRSWVREQSERLAAQSRRLRFTDGEAGKYRFDEILGTSPALLATLERAARLIPHPNVTVLVTGETGTGKELLARALHYNGPRRGAPFVDVNCAAIPEQLLESELFGHEKGAFTDATATKPGLFELARGGTVFLDEIGHLPLALQGKLLRVLQERQIRRIGGVKSIAVDVRVVAATHVDLAIAVQRGEFREDLYYRLSVVPVELPPLRLRRGDIVPLAHHFLTRFIEEYRVPSLRLTAEAERELQRREWRGNVRELRNAIERAVLLSDGLRIDADALAPESPGRQAAGDLPFPGPLSILARAAAQAMVARCDGNKSEAARQLEISRTRLQRLLDAADDEVDAAAAAVVLPFAASRPHAAPVVEARA